MTRPNTGPATPGTPLRLVPPPLAARTRAAYHADWLAFSIWCEAVEQNPLPAEPATILQFLSDNSAQPATQARRLAAINRIHLEHRHRPPGADPTVRTQITQLHPTLPAGQIAPDPAVIDRVLTRIPAGGWPTGMFGRRDALLLTLRYRACLTLPQLLTLTGYDLHLEENRQLRIEAAGRTVVLPPTDDPATCPTCIWRRWRTILTLAAKRSSNRTMADRLKRAELSPTAHNCLTPPASAGPDVAIPVFMPIDRWGSLPGIFRATTTRTAIALATSHLSDRPPVHPAIIDAEQAADLLTNSPIYPATPPAAAPIDYAPTYAAGLTARRHAVAQLRHVEHDLEDLDRAAEELNSRILELSRMFDTT